MFIEEASVWVRIEKHPFIVRAYLGRHIFNGQPFVITEYIRGQEGLGNDLTVVVRQALYDPGSRY